MFKKLASGAEGNIFETRQELEPIIFLEPSFFRPIIKLRSNNLRCDKHFFLTCALFWLLK